MVRALLLSALTLAPASGSPADEAAPQKPAVPAPEAPRQGLEALLAQVDQAYARRDEAGAMDEMRARLDEAEKLAPNDYEVLWRQARHFFWLSDDPSLPNDQKSKLGKKGWDYGERAIAADPSRVEGWHYAAAGMGNYSLGIGIFRALGEGIEGKFKDHLSHAEKIAPGFENGGIQTAWGRFWYKLPWPKYDPKKSEKALLAAIGMNPDNVRAHVYLADLYRSEHRSKDAQAELARAAEGEPGRYDAPEERRWQAVARQELAKP
ncbi:MAG TPA: hypothetical protein VML50_08435 [Anaeromyxobacter sp.]|nr:hypothetical protein [Anaeromyxobacter sp.]